jgi:hypothetical protein
VSSTRTQNGAGGGNGLGALNAGSGGETDGASRQQLPPPSFTKLAAPKVVGSPTPKPPLRVLPAGEPPPFDSDGT